MEKLIPLTFNLTAALLCLGLGLVVLARNPRRYTNQTFALLAANLMLWSFGVYFVIGSETQAEAYFWIVFTEIVACFIPSNMYLFVGFFPRGHFVGSRTALGLFYATSAVLAMLATTPLYVVDVQVFADMPPRAQHGPLMAVFLVLILAALFAIHHNLRRKLYNVAGQGRSQVQFVLFGVYSIAVVNVVTIVFAELLGLTLFQAYGPVTVTLFMAIFAYAMIRFHLLDTRSIVSKGLVYFASAAIIFLTFQLFAVVAQVLVSEPVRFIELWPALFSALLLAFAFPKVKTRIRRTVEGTLLKGQYDIHKVYQRIAEEAAEEVQLDRLLERVTGEIQRSIGVKIIRVLLVDEKNRDKLITKFTTWADDPLEETEDRAGLLDYLRANPGPLLLEKILHGQPDPHMIRVAEHLAELEAYFCLPLKTSQGLVGLVTMGQKNSQEVYTEAEVLAFRALAGPLGIAIANARLYQELEHVHDHLSRVFGQMREGVVAVNTDGVIMTVNKAAAKLVGEDQEGRTLEALPTEVAALLRTTLEQKRAISDYESTIHDLEGETIAVVMSSSYMDNTAAQVSGAVALIYDLSALKRLEENVMRADRLSSIGLLAAGMAHEIKNPLVSIKTFSQLLQQRYEDADFRATFEEVVPEEVDRIDTIVCRLLDFAKPKPISFELLPVTEVIDGVLQLVENQIAKNQVEIVRRYPDETLIVKGDEQQLHQVFLNLVLNAHDAMREHGGELVVSVETGHARFRKKGLVGLLESECVRVSLTDTGCGIEPDHLKNLFTPFFTTKEKGSGLGLSVVHSIITEHGGEIDVKSVVGHGATFTISLPLVRTLKLAGTSAGYPAS